MAYLWGSFISMKVLTPEERNHVEANKILFQLNLAHILTPISTLCSNLADAKELYVLSKLFDTFSIFQYQGTIFYAQYYQMNSSPSQKLSGINVWFIIEILSFYGYILSAMIFIWIKAVESSLDWQNTSHMKMEYKRDRYKYDYLAYHEKDINWVAFVFILTYVNVSLILIDEFVIFANIDTSLPENADI